MSNYKTFWIYDNSEEPCLAFSDTDVYKEEIKSYPDFEVIEIKALHHLQAKYSKLKNVMKKIANEDYRGNRSNLSIDAELILKELGEL